MALGYNKPLYILPFDHRGSFQTGMFGWKGSLSPEQTAQIAAAKQVIYDGFKAAVAAGVAKERAGILVDEQFGSAILRDAAKHGYVTAAPAEKSGQDEFDFEYGDDFARHIETFNLTFCKVLVRYNPEGDKDMNAQQTQRLQQLSEYLRHADRKYMFELLVPATPEQLQQVGGDRKRYDLERRPALMVRAIRDTTRGGRRARYLEDRGIGSPRGLRTGDRDRSPGWARRRRLHRSRPGGGRGPRPYLAHHRRWRAGIYRLRRRTDDFLGSSDRLA